LFDFNTKNDLEDLPTTWGGYDKLPMRAKYFHKQGKAIVAMSGKFHTSWGEFGGFKHPDALRYEAASMLAFGVRCNFGDQLHPEGEMDLGTYRNVGEAFAYVETMGEYGVEAKPVANLGVWPSGCSAHDEGSSVMLLEAHVDFDVVGTDEPLDRYEAIVLPSATVLSDKDAARLNAYAAAGGGVLALGSSALDATRTRVVLDIGAEHVGTGNYDVDYLVVGDAVAGELVRSPFLNYASGLRVQPHSGTEVLAAIREPYFSRTYARYCSHQNTPYRMEPAPHPGMLRRGNIIWSAHALDEMYQVHGARVHRQLFINALRLLHRHPMVEAGLPSAGRISLLHQPDKSRYVLHLLYSPALPRGRCKVIEDLVPLHDVPIRLRLPREVVRITQMPGGTELPFTGDDDGLSLTVPTFTCHCALVLETR
jgi:hypothetical protein